MLEALLERAEIYALGQHLKLSGNNIQTRFDEACQYLLENTYNKLGYLRVLQQEPERELHAVLHSDDITQLGLTLMGKTATPRPSRKSSNSSPCVPPVMTACWLPTSSSASTSAPSAGPMAKSSC